MLFELGQVVATPAALDLLEQLGETPDQYLYRHMTGDWGDLDEEDVAENQFALEKGNLRIFSSYKTRLGKLWIITESTRESTTILLPEDY